MADSHPFSNAGLGMFGADASLARQAATPDGASDKMKKLLGGMAGLACRLYRARSCVHRLRRFLCLDSAH